MADVRVLAGRHLVLVDLGFVIERFVADDFDTLAGFLAGLLLTGLRHHVQLCYMVYALEFHARAELSAARI